VEDGIEAQKMHDVRGAHVFQRAFSRSDADRWNSALIGIPAKLSAEPITPNSYLVTVTLTKQFIAALCLRYGGR
jgi:hypothetical protein